MFSAITKSIRVTKTATAAIDHIITNSLLHGSIDTTINKLDIFDSWNRKQNDTGAKSAKRLEEMIWDDALSSKQSTIAYEDFLKKLIPLYYKFFEKKSGSGKIENTKKPSLNLEKQSKGCEINFWSQNLWAWDSYKTYYKLFESIKQRAKSQ